jgi:hypothetical protein
MQEPSRNFCPDEEVDAVAGESHWLHAHSLHLYHTAELATTTEAST